MAKTIDRSQDASEKGLDAMTALLLTTSVLEVFTGTRPATTATADSGTLVATHTMSADAFADAGNDTTRAKADANAIANATVPAPGGTAGYWRLRTIAGGGVVIFQGDVSTTGADTGSLQYDDIVFVEAGIASVSAFSLFLDNAGQ